MITRTMLLLNGLLLLSAAAADKTGMSFKKCSVSRQNLVAGSLVSWQAGAPVFHSDVPSSSVQVLRVLALRVEFQEDDDEKTTGRGLFEMEPSEALTIDPAPHDRAYFESQLAALANYYRTVSNGLLEIAPTVSGSVYTLPAPMKYYSPAAGTDLDDTRLAELFRDAVLTADTAGEVFSDYDCFIIFHAGVGNDINLGYDPTPHDIPSVFLSSSDLAERLENGVSPEGIPVEDGGFYVAEGVILPESQSQEGYEIGLLGTMTLMFGFQLGMPALWDVETGRSGIGRWGLMDQGSGNYNGLIPARPSAWTRVLMGWEEPVTVHSGMDLVLARAGADIGPRVYKVPLNSEEYFLIENRQYDADKDSVAVGRDAAGREVVFRADGRIGTAGDIGVIVAVDDYDYGLPGSGILIWHVDEKVIKETFADNRVNTGGPVRGVALEEADGAQDIGESYGMFNAGGGSEYGVMHDAWYRDNDIHLLANSAEEVLFAADTYPPSRSNTGADSRVRISGFSKSDTLMTFSVNGGRMQAGFPAEVPPGQAAWEPLYGDIDGDSRTDLIVATPAGHVYAWQHDGTPVCSNDDSFYRQLPGGDSVAVDMPLFTAAAGGYPAAPVIAPYSGGTGSMLVTVDNTGRLRGFRGSAAERNGYALQVFETGPAAGAPVCMAVIDARILLGTENGRIISFTLDGQVERDYLTGGGAVTGFCRTAEGMAASVEHLGLISFDQAGEVLWTSGGSAAEQPRDPAAAARTSSGSTAVTLIHADGISVIGADGEAAGGPGAYMLPQNVSAPALGDMDGDGRVETAVTGSGSLWLFSESRALVNYFPVPGRQRDVMLSAPILADIDGDGRAEAVVTASDGAVEAYGTDGRPVQGFPLSAGRSPLSAPTVLDLDGDGDMELACVSEAGYVYVWDLEAGCSEGSVPWGMRRHDPSGTARYTLDGSGHIQPGSGLMPEKSVYNYPNPAVDGYTTIRYYLEKPAEVTVRIYDLTGRLRQELSGPGSPAADNEVVWDVSGVDSGVYFCTVKAVSGDESKSVRFRIGVVK